MAELLAKDDDLDRAYRELGDRDDTSELDSLEREGRSLDTQEAQEDAPPAPAAVPQAPAPAAPAGPAPEGEELDLAERPLIGDVSLDDLTRSPLTGMNIGLPVMQGLRDAAVTAMQNVNMLGDWLRDHGIGPKSKLMVRVPDIDAPDSTSERIVSTAANFLAGFIPGMKATKAFGITRVGMQGAVSGLVADLSVMDPTQPQIADLIQNLAPEVRLPLVEYLQSDPADNRPEQLFKQAVQGVLTGVLADGVFRAGRAMFKAGQTRLLAGETGEESLTQAVAAPMPVGASPDLASVRTADGFVDVPAVGTGVGTVGSRPDEALELKQFLRRHGDGNPELPSLLERAGFIPNATPESVESLLARSRSGEAVVSPLHPDVLEGLLGDAQVRESYQELRRIAMQFDELTEQQVAGTRPLAEVTAEAEAVIAEGPGAQVRTPVAPVTPDDIRQVFPNEAMNDVQTSVLAQQLMRVGGQVQDQAKRFLGTGDAADWDAFVASFSMLGELDPTRMGVRAAGSRALGIWRDPVKSFNGYLDQFGALFEQARVLGTESAPGVTPRRFAEMAASLRTPHEVSELAVKAAKALPGSTKARLNDVINEAWISSLLSGPKTQLANMLSNASVTAWAIPERLMASAVGDVSSAEGVGMLFGTVKGFRQGLRLAGRAFIEEAPQFGEEAVRNLTKIETRVDKAISAEALELSGPLGSAVDFIGKAIRIGPRTLMAADEFFKGVNYQMQLHSLAWDEAVKRAGGTGADLGPIIADLIDNPTSSMRSQAEDFAFYQTFTRDLNQEGVPFQRLGEGTQRIGDGLRRIPMGRVIAPFVRTPTNILRFSLERTPLGLMSSNVRKAIRQGGRERALALSKLMTGSMVMATAASYVAEGRLSGRGPTDPRLRQRLRETGWQPYSVLVGDTWVSYNRFDPTGQLFGMAADITNIIGEVDKVTADRLVGGAISTIWQNLGSKTYMRGISDAMGVLAPQGWATPEQAGTPGARFVARLGGTVIPTVVADIARSQDRTLRETRGEGFFDTMINTVYSRMPGYSQELPPRLNFWADPIILGGGLGPDIISPFFTSDRQGDPVANEVARLQIPLAMPSKVFDRKGTDGSTFELNPRQYNKLVELSNGIGLEGAPKLKPLLERVIKTTAYQNLTDGPEGGKALVIRRHVQQYRSAARLALMDQDEGVKRELIKRRSDRATALSGEAVGVEGLLQR